MRYENVAAVYDAAAHADVAVNTLKSTGYPDYEIRVIRDGRRAEYRLY